MGVAGPVDRPVDDVRSRKGPGLHAADAARGHPDVISLARSDVPDGDLPQRVQGFHLLGERSTHARLEQDPVGQVRREDRVSRERGGQLRVLGGEVRDEDVAGSAKVHLQE